MNDTTIYTNLSQGIENPEFNNEPLQTPSFDVNNKKNDKAELAAKIGAGVVGGGVLGAGLMFGAEAVASQLQGDGEDVQADLQDQAESHLQIAHHVNDGMSFDEAFAAARAEVGAGGVFVWRGGVYGTYNSDEWNAMSAEDRAAFTDHAMEQYGGQTGQAAQPQQVQQEIHTEIHQEVHHIYHEDAEGATGAQAASTPASATHISADDDSGVRVIGDVYQENLDGQIVDVAQIQYEGHDGIIVDVDRDGEFDIAGIDFNDNGRLDENEIITLVEPQQDDDVLVMDDHTSSIDATADIQVIDVNDDPVSLDDDSSSYESPYSDTFDGDFTAESSMDDFGDDIYMADNQSADGMDDFVNDANVDMLA